MLDALVERGLADPDRLGVIGLSYGGFITNWLVGTSDRFRAAVSENGVANQVSAWANSDCGPDYCASAELGDAVSADGCGRAVAAVAAAPRRQHPHATPASCRRRRTCAARPADAEQLFVALRWLRREVELVLYPEEYHAYQGTGRPDRREDRHARVLDWFTRYLPVSGRAASLTVGRG